MLKKETIYLWVIGIAIVNLLVGAITNDTFCIIWAMSILYGSQYWKK